MSTTSKKNYRAYSSKHNLKRWIFSKMVESSVLSVTLKGITYWCEGMEPSLAIDKCCWRFERGIDRGPCNCRGISFQWGCSGIRIGPRLELGMLWYKWDPWLFTGVIIPESWAAKNILYLSAEAPDVLADAGWLPVIDKGWVLCTSLLSGVTALASDRLIAESFGCINGNFDESDKGGGRVHAPAFASGPAVSYTHLRAHET